MRHEHVLSTIGNTPVVRIRRLAPRGVRVYGKVEAANPLGSIKDRLALGVIEDAERRGRLRPGQTVVEATSGNTGIGLAMVCAAKGYPLVVVMAENFSVERRRILRFLGARVVLTPASQRGTGMLAKAVELAETHGWFLCRQFENEANAEVHSRTTAREILADFAGERLDAWVTGFGTGGTLLGVARVLRAERPDTRIVVCEPDNSPVLASGMAQVRREDGSPAGSHPVFRTHPVQGWAPDSVPRLAEAARAEGLIDEFLGVDSGEGVRLSRELAGKEGLFVGISAGATLAGALQVAEGLPEGANVLCMLPDTGERYLSTPLFEGVGEEMTDEEIEISRSTPGQRFDVPVPGVVVGEEEESVDPAAAAFVEEAIGGAAEVVVMFGLRWCEFCWSVRRLFERTGVPFRCHDLDAAGFAEGGWGDRVRAALRVRTGARTVPQVFVGGRLVGGCTEVFDAWEAGELQEALRAAGVAFDGAAVVGAHGLLPGWLQPRGSGVGG